MDQNRSNSVPLMYSNNGYSSLPRLSCSLPSLQPTTQEFPTSINWNEEAEDKEEEEEAIRELSEEDDHDSILSSSSNDETSVAMHGRKALNQSKPLTMNALSSDILYEDIWADSPIFHEYLKSLESFLHRYLTWLEKVEQCRQLEIAYTKSIALLFEQTKQVLNEPFYCPTEFQSIQWPKEEVFSEDQDEMLKHILPCLRNHGTKIKEILTRFECIIKDLRTKHAQSSNAYCASQKLTMPQTNIKLLDEMSTSLYLAKKSLCKALLEYIHTLNNLIKSTRYLIDEKLGPLMGSLQSVKRKNLKILEELVLISASFQDNKSKNGTGNPVLHFPFEDCHELNNERLSYYIQEKLTSYHTCLKKSCSLSEQYAKGRPLSPTSLIPFTFLSRPKVIQRYNSLDSIISNNIPAYASRCLHITTKGYLLVKKKQRRSQSTQTNGSIKDSVVGKWERCYFFISKEDGCLKQYINHTTIVSATNLKTANVQPSETDKRDFVILIASQDNHAIIRLQAETAIDFMTWLQALQSWNPNQETVEPFKKTKSKSMKSKSLKKSYVSSQSYSSSQHKSLLSKKSTSSILPAEKNNMELFSTTMVRNSNSADYENQHSELYGYPIPITECPINCCSTTGIMDHSKVQMTGLFRIHKSCIEKSSCISHHTGALCVLHVSLFEDGTLHMQTEKDENALFHRPIQLSMLSSQDIYPFSDSIDHMKYCIVVRPKLSETYHLLTSSKIQRDAWLFRLKQSCKGDGSNKLLIGDLNKPLPENPRSVYSLTVRIAEARRLHTSPKDSMHSELYCDIVVDNEIRGLTGSIKKSASVFWKEEFQFSDISKVNYGVTINMYTKSNKNDREAMFGTVFLPVSLIDASNTIQEEWYEIRKENRHKAFASLTSLGSSNGFCGQIRVGVLLEKYKVYSLDIYQPLMDVLTEFRHDMVYDMARKSSDVQMLARNLLRIYEGMGMTLAWMKSLIDYEVSALNTDDVNILFRGNSFFTKVLDNYMKMNGKEFLEESLQHTIQNICKLSLHIEVEPSRLTNSTLDSTMANSSELFSHVRSIWEGIQKAKTKCPIELRKIFGYLQAAIVKKFNLSKNTLDKQYQLTRYTCVSGFIFLRWICPAIISPKQFGLVQDHPDTKTCRTLTLIAKCLMTLASHNSLEQNSKEAWMMCLNEFVQNNTHQFVNFINFISTDDHSSVRQKQETPYLIDLALELSQLTSWCSHDCHVINTITRTCKSINGIHRSSNKVDETVNRKKVRPRPWRYGDEYFKEVNEGIIVRPSVAE